MVMVTARVDIDAELAERADAIFSALDGPSAREVAEKLIGEAPELVNEWVSRHLAALLTEFVGRRWRARNARQGFQAKAGAFADAVEEFMAGNDEQISVFLTPMPVNDDGRRVLLGDMTAADHRYVAGRHRTLAMANKMQAAFHEAIAKRVGNRTTSEVFTEEEYLNLRKQHLKGEE